MILRALLVCCLLLSAQTLVNGQNASEVAKAHLKSKAAELGFVESDFGDLSVAGQNPSAHNGLTHVYLQQRVGGIPVYNGVVSMAVRAGEVFYMAGEENLVANLQSSLQGGALGSPEDAVRDAAIHLGFPDASGFGVIETLVKNGNSYNIVSRGNAAIEPSIVRSVIYNGQTAWEVLIWPISGPGEIDTNGENWWEVIVNGSGDVLYQRDILLTENWGDIPFAGLEEFGQIEEVEPFASVAALQMVGTYNVVPLYVESPNHGALASVSNPDQDGPQAGTWHVNTIGGNTDTRGNNVFACQDLDANNVCGALSTAEGGGGLNFPFVPDFGMAPTSYKDAAVTNLFYWNNLMHDVWYNYGYDEASGNFQDDNFANGGTGSDEVNADAQDGSGTNNANFGTPPDGFNPRMQMFQWTYPFPNELLVNSPPGIAGAYIASGAAFTAAPVGQTANLIVPVANAVAVGAPENGCGNGAGNAGAPLIYQNAAAMAGQIAFIDRGACSFDEKVGSAELSGAIAAVICNNNAGSPINMGGADARGIPAAMLSMADCDLIKPELFGGNLLVVNATLQVAAAPLPSRDSDYDSGIIAHEYGHGISNRLTGGPATTGCLSNAEQMGEGWSDYFGLMMTSTSASTAAEARGIGTYSIFQPTSGNGIRPTPYSTNFAVNPSTYATSNNTASISQPHGIGYVWASAIWEMTWSLVNGDTVPGGPVIPGRAWDNDIYNGIGGNNVAMQLVMDGLKLQGCSPGFVAGRDGILAASNAMTGATPGAPGAQECLIWTAMARRGLGTGASQGSAFSRIDQVENFLVPTTCVALVLPVELANFEGKVDGDKINLTWSTLSETNNSGFELELKTGGVFRQLDFIEGNGTTTERRDYSYTVSGLPAGTQVFRLKQLDFDGAFEYSPEIEVAVGVPGEYQLSSAYPNPFNPSTQFTLAIAQEQDVRIDVYNVEGRRVSTLHQGALSANEQYTFSFDAASMPSGLYAFKVIGETFTAGQTVMLQK